MKWINLGFVGAYSNITQIYTKNCLFELRPWYVETLTPEAKDVVIILNARTIEHLELAQKAAKTVLSTLSPLDRVLPFFVS